MTGVVKAVIIIIIAFCHYHRHRRCDSDGGGGGSGFQRKGKTAADFLGPYKVLCEGNST